MYSEITIKNIFQTLLGFSMCLLTKNINMTLLQTRTKKQRNPRIDYTNIPNPPNNSHPYASGSSVDIQN